MRWSSNLGKVAGIQVKVHATFALILIWVAATYWIEERSLIAVAQGLIFILALFACVVLHELGHALTARRFGVETRDIILLPIGGVARLQRIPEEPRQELWVAIAGPAVNVVIAAGLAVWLELTDGWVPVENLSASGGSFFERLLIVNVFLVIFNLIPAFPMDGGRVLRALLAMRMNYVRATRIAASIGQALALGFGFLGLLGSNPFLVFIAFFVWIGASQEATMVQTKAALSGVALERVMITDFQGLSPADSLGHAIELTLAGSQKDFPVLDAGQLVGVLTQDRLLQALADGGPGQRVDAAMERQVEIAELSEMVEPVFQRLQSCDCRTLPVMRGGRLAGLVTMDNVGEYLRIHSALTE